MKFYYGYITDGWGFVDENDPRVDTENMVELTEEEHLELLQGQSSGLDIVYYDGKVFNAEPDYYYVDDNNEWQKRTEEEVEEIRYKRNRQHLDSLILTPSDVERALYKAKGMDFEDLKALIAEQIPTIDIKALAIEFRARDFYRGAVAGGIRLFDVVGALLGYTPADMDYLFLNKQLPEPTDDDHIEESEEL